MRSRRAPRAPPTRADRAGRGDGLTITGAELVELGRDRVDVLTTSADDVPTISLSSAGGDLDGDGLSDLVALLDFGTDEEGVTQTRIYVALGATYRGQRIRGLSLPFEAISPRLVVVDLDADGTDEVAILSVETLSLHALK